MKYAEPQGYTIWQGEGKSPDDYWGDLGKQAKTPPVQGQRQLSGCSGKDLQQEVIIPGAAAAFSDDAILAGMLLEQGE